MSKENMASDAVYIVRFVGWFVAVLLGIALPFVGFMTIPFLMCAEGACPTDQQNYAWTIILVFWGGYVGVFACAFMAIKWAKRRIAKDDTNGKDAA